MQTNNNDADDFVKMFEELRQRDFEKKQAEEAAKEKPISPYGKDVPMQYKNIAKSLPIKSLLMEDDSGVGKSSLMLHWQWLAKQLERRCLYTSENKLMTDLYYNEYGNKVIDSKYMDRIRYCQILMIDEMFNSKNWMANFENTYFTIGSLIEELYEYKRHNKLIVIVATNNPIEKFLQEKSIVRKFNELFMYD
jgi:DNA replication protein DnaC